MTAEVIRKNWKCTSSRRRALNLHVTYCYTVTYWKDICCGRCLYRIGHGGLTAKAKPNLKSHSNTDFLPLNHHPPPLLPPQSPPPPPPPPITANKYYWAPCWGTGSRRALWSIATQSEKKKASWGTPSVGCGRGWNSAGLAGVGGKEAINTLVGVGDRRCTWTCGESVQQVGAREKMASKLNWKSEINVNRCKQAKCLWMCVCVCARDKGVKEKISLALLYWPPATYGHIACLLRALIFLSINQCVCLSVWRTGCLILLISSYFRPFVSIHLSFQFLWYLRLLKFTSFCSFISISILLYIFIYIFHNLFLSILFLLYKDKSHSKCY